MSASGPLADHSGKALGRPVYPRQRTSA